MYILSKEEFVLQAEPKLRQVFVGNEDTEPFTCAVQERLLLYFPLGGDSHKNEYLENKLFEAIAAAAEILGNTGCYFVIGWEYLNDETGKGRYVYIPTLELKEAFVPLSTERDKIIWNQLDLDERFLDFCFCSAEGDWGLLKTIDDYAFLGGTSEFIQAVKSYFPEVEKEVHEFLHDFKLAQIGGEEINIQWLRQLLNHIYGSTIAKRMIIDSGLIIK